jgi:hypothetical protein
MDGDGCLDVVVSSAHGGCGLYRNNGDGTFADITVGSGLDECVNAFAIEVGDHNNDGRLPTEVTDWQLSERSPGGHD